MMSRAAVRRPFFLTALDHAHDDLHAFDDRVEAHERNCDGQHAADDVRPVDGRRESRYVGVVRVRCGLRERHEAVGEPDSGDGQLRGDGFDKFDEFHFCCSMTFAGDRPATVELFVSRAS